jgi:hypothetical protein
MKIVFRMKICHSCEGRNPLNQIETNNKHIKTTDVSSSVPTFSSGCIENLKKKQYACIINAL